MEGIQTVAALGPVKRTDDGHARAMLIEVIDGLGGPISEWIVGEEVVVSGEVPRLTNHAAFPPHEKTLAWRSFCDYILVQATDDDAQEDVLMDLMA